MNERVLKLNKGDLPEGLKDALRDLLSPDQVNSHGPEATDDEQIKTMKELVHVYGKNPFKKGDVITPRPSSNHKWAGRPHIVVEAHDVDTKNMPDFPSEYHGHMSEGTRYDLRTLVYIRGSYAPFWGESWMYELWTPDKAKAAKKNGKAKADEDPFDVD